MFRPSNSTWYFRRTTAGFTAQTWGAAGDLPVPADYDGDGKVDLAVFRPSNSTWYFIGTTTGIGATPFGTSEDKPTPNSFVY